MAAGALVVIALIGAAFAQDPAAVALPTDPAPASAVTTDVPAALWAGQQVTIGTRHVALIGDISSRTVVTTLARVVPDGDGWLIIDRPCAIDVQAAHGVVLAFDPGAVRNMPAISYRFAPTDAGYVAGPWIGGWGDQDVDGDGVGGIHVRVRAPVCGGAIDVASRTESVATGDPSPSGAASGLSGSITVTISRDIVGTSNACLALLDHHTDEVVTGGFAWAPVPEGSTCESLSGAVWPAQAPDPGVVDLGDAAR